MTYSRTLRRLDIVQFKRNALLTLSITTLSHSYVELIKEETHCIEELVLHPTEQRNLPGRRQTASSSPAVRSGSA